jgi:hypothetical protein
VDVDVDVVADVDVDEAVPTPLGSAAGTLRLRAVVVTTAGSRASLAVAAGTLRLRAVVVTTAGSTAALGSATTSAARGVNRLRGGGSSAAEGGAAGAAAGSVAGAGGSGGAAGESGACARARAAASARPFIGGGAYASFPAMASEPREAFGDLATTAFVESSILFRSLDEGARLDLLQVCQLQSFSPDEVISTAADDRFLIVRDGSAAVVADGPTGPVELYRLERGALFGVGRALGKGRVAWLQALSDVTVVGFPAPVIGVLAERFPKVKKLLEAVQAARDKEAASRLAS